jgi:hypothetical protein
MWWEHQTAWETVPNTPSGSDRRQNAEKMGPKNKPTTWARNQDKNENIQSLFRPFSWFNSNSIIRNCRRLIDKHLCTMLNRPIGEWCSCGECKAMDTKREHVCCNESHFITPHRGELRCIGNVGIFKELVVNKDGLMYSRYMYSINIGDPDKRNRFLKRNWTTRNCDSQPTKRLWISYHVRILIGISGTFYRLVWSLISGNSFRTQRGTLHWLRVYEIIWHTIIAVDYMKLHRLIQSLIK